MFQQNGMSKTAFQCVLVTLFAGMVACDGAAQFLPVTPGNPLHVNASPSTTPVPPTGRFVPGDPTATPLGNDITDPVFVQGVSAYQAKKYEEAIALMSRVIQANPRLAPPYRYRGMAYWYLKDCNSALDDFEEALSINPDYAAAWAGHGNSVSCLGDEAQAYADYRKALTIDPSLAFVHHNLGVEYFDQGEYEKALEEYTLTVAIDPTRSGAWSGKAEALGRLGRYPECIDNATTALEINPQEWLAYNDRALCESQAGDFSAAVKDYQTYLAHDASHAENWYNLGNAQSDAGLISDSIDSYSRALELNPSFPAAYINRGVGYVNLEEYDHALADFNQALTFGDIPLAYVGRGNVYYGLEKYDLALIEYNKAISLAPNLAVGYCGAALAYFEIGQYQDALEAADISTALDPARCGQQMAEVQARAYYQLGDNQKALLYINKALEMGEYSLGHYYRGLIYQAGGKHQEALDDYNFFLTTIQDIPEFENEISDARARTSELMP